MSYLPFSGNCIANVYESNESDKDENISEDLPLKLTVQPYQYEPVRRQDTAQQPCNDNNELEQ